jgi:two-component system OmpR family sensor kinase
LLSENRQAQLFIEDNGPGFSPDLRGHVFERFVKGEHSRGRGLGLAFVNAVAQAHNGSVRISDPSDGGASIELALPLSASARPLAHQAEV